VTGAAKVPREPNLTNAALRTNVSFSNDSKKRDKIKGNFAKGLWQQIFELFRSHLRECQNERFWKIQRTLLKSKTYKIKKLEVSLETM